MKKLLKKIPLKKEQQRQKINMKIISDKDLKKLLKKETAKKILNMHMELIIKLNRIQLDYIIEEKNKNIK